MKPAAVGPDDTFRTYIEHWLAAFVSRLPAASTREGYARAMRLYWLPALGERPIDGLRPSDIEAVLDGLRERGLRPSTIKSAYLVLSSAMTRAKAERIVTNSPTDFMTTPRTDGRTCRWMTRDEAVRYIEALLVPAWSGSYFWYGPLVAAALMTGLRFGELRGLRWENVDLWGEDARDGDADGEAGNIHVCEQIYSGHKSARFTAPKSASSVRDVPVTADLARLLLQHRERVRRHARKVGTRAWQDYNLVFPNRVGGPATPEVVTHTRAEAAAMVGVEPVPTMNALRHTYATTLVDGGLPPHVVAKLLGHADVRLTCNTYFHAGPVSRKLAVDALGELRPPTFRRA